MLLFFSHSSLTLSDFYQFLPVLKRKQNNISLHGLGARRASPVLLKKLVEGKGTGKGGEKGGSFHESPVALWCSAWSSNQKVKGLAPNGRIRIFSSEPPVSLTDWKNIFLMYSPGLKFTIKFLLLCINANRYSSRNSMYRDVCYMNLEW